MTPLVFTGVVVGLLGSLHCLGMCGPIVLAAPKSRASQPAAVLQQLWYHAGRGTMYLFLGLALGTVGEWLVIGSWQGTISIVSGVSILTLLILPRVMRQQKIGSFLSRQFVVHFGGVWNRLLSSHSFRAQFSLGLLNGLLPCGLVYVALAGSLALADPLASSVYMLLFGVGTTPALIALVLVGSRLPAWVKTRANRIVPIATATVGLLLILRGMSLGIPLVSPKIASEPPAPPSNAMHAEPIGSCCK